ncbi:hypothetical protein GBF38_005970 [Nibea albiflora]|uniref:Uncharacterized protein n=1 Tax=Nibea albiflora TaxID=240163 RepID=A0ACB7FAH5_NIBAL|nr:hypothetical protein GBF38_005970 [Nibea albiflora]
MGKKRLLPPVMIIQQKEATANEEENDATCDESKEPAEAATTEDESGTEKETDAISKAESMEELAEDAKMKLLQESLMWQLQLKRNPRTRLRKQK